MVGGGWGGGRRSSAILFFQVLPFLLHATHRHPPSAHLARPKARVAHVDHSMLAVFPPGNAKGVKLQWECYPTMLNWIKAMASVHYSLRGNAVEHWKSAAPFFTDWPTEPGPSKGSITSKFEKVRKDIKEADRHVSFRQAVQHYGVRCDKFEDHDRFDLLIQSIDQKIPKCASPHEVPTATGLSEQEEDPLSSSSTGPTISCVAIVWTASVLDCCATQ